MERFCKNTPGFCFVVVVVVVVVVFCFVVVFLWREGSDRNEVRVR